MIEFRESLGQARYVEDTAVKMVGFLTLVHPTLPRKEDLKWGIMAGLSEAGFECHKKSSWIAAQEREQKREIPDFRSSERI